LLDSTRLRNEEIEQIVAAPQLFDAVKARIKNEQRERKSRLFTNNHWSFPIWNRQVVTAASAVLILLAFGAFSLILMRNSVQPEEQIAKTPEIPVKTIAEETIQKKFIEDSAEIELAEKSFVKPQAKRAVFKKEMPKPQKTAPKQIRTKKPADIETEPGGEFFALNYTGNPNETGEALRVVRAELSRSTLFALGVNLPIENESQKIKTDLLVGTDGVARAIRFVD
jgi:hypothetical protein